MSPTTIRPLVSSLALAGALLLAPAAIAQSGSATPHGSAKGASSPQATDPGASREMHRQMMNDMKPMQSLKMSGDMDRDFASMMKMHHQQAIRMAKSQLANGKSPELKAMAQKIVDDQTKEIAQLDAWLAKHK
jgi:uncharacterized protein (DUF305 family)